MVESGAGRSSLGVGRGLITEYLTAGSNATAAKLLPGTAVEIDTVDYNVKEFDGTGSVIGTIGYETCVSNWKPTNRDTAYAAGANMPIEIGPSCRRMILATSQTIVKGAPLKCVADGQVSAATVGTDDVYCDADESVTTTSATKYIWVITRR